jgi:hypothetical protein
MSEPRFPHDCDACIFLGQLEQADLYYCPQAAIRTPTLLARFGTHGADYGTWNVAGCGEPLEEPFITAASRARACGCDLARPRPPSEPDR